MPTLVPKIIDPNGTGDYASLYDWEVYLGTRNLVTNDEIQRATNRCTGGTADTTGVVFDGPTTGGNNYLHIWTDPAESYRHAGKWVTGNKARMSVAGMCLDFRSAVAHVRIEGLQLNSTGAYAVIGAWLSATAEIRLTESVLYGGSNTRTWGPVLTPISNGSSGSKFIAANNVIYDFTGAGSEIYAYGSTGHSVFFFNNTFHNCNKGLSIAAGSITAKNNIFKTVTTCASGTFAAGSGYNATNNASLGYTVTGGATGDRVSQTFTFVNEDADDFHLASNDAGALGYGTNLYADENYAFQTDIDGQDRGGSGATWDIGADEYVAAGGSSIPVFMHNYRRRRI